jgi:putative oxidoreductase
MPPSKHCERAEHPARCTTSNPEKSTMASIAQSLTLSKSSTSALAAPIVLVGRLLFALIFIMAALNHFASQTIAFAASQGVPLASILVPISGVIALLGGFSILLGYRARVGGWLIALFLLGVTPMHKFWGIADPMMHQMQMVMFMKNLSMLGGALLISQFGAGPWSLDNRR